MKTPPFLLGVTLLFWGWQTGFYVAGAVMAVALEAARFVRARWEFSDDDFGRIWTVCTLLFLGTAVYAFTDNGGPSHFSSFFQNPTPSNQSGMGVASARTAAAVFRWLPMIFFIYVAAVAYNPRPEIPWTTLSPLLRRRWKRAEKSGRPLPAARGIDVSYPYLAMCLFSASVHASETNTYFWGLCALLAWALWSRRTRRFGSVTWASALAAAFVLGYFGQQSIGRLQSYIQNLDPEWLTRFMHRRGLDPTQSRTALGQIGRVKTSGRIVLRLETKDGSAPPNYLREATYRVFSTPFWRAGGARDNFESVINETNNNATWLLVPGKVTMAKIGIACYLESRSRESQAPIGLLPLPSGSGRLESLPVFWLKKNGAGAVLAEGPGLVVFDALYGPGATMDAPFNLPESMFSSNSVPLPGVFWPNKNSFTNNYGSTTNPDLNVPPGEEAAVSQVIGELHIPKGNREVAIRAIRGYFQTNFSYSMWQEQPRVRGAVDSPLTRFLLQTHKGHCEYFATATVLLLRQAGIPARYAVGYAVHETAGRGSFVVRQRDSHAWCIVWNERNRTWQDFDTTPASWVEHEAKEVSPLQKVADFWSWVQFQFSKFRWGQSNIRQYLLMGLVPVVGLLLYQIFFRRQLHRRGQKEQGDLPVPWPGLDSEFYLFEKKVAERGVVRRAGEPLSSWLRRALANPALAGAKSSLRELLRLHYRYRFDPQGLRGNDREELKRMTRLALDELEVGGRRAEV